MRPGLQKLFINGPIGKLEAILAKPEPVIHGLAVIAHPHPLYGGTMDNKIVHTLFNSLFKLGFISVKFNFRGVGASEGCYDQGNGEIEDVIAVVETMRNHYPEQSNNLLLAGFSFGGAIQAHAAQRLNPQKLVLVAPSVTNQKAPPVTPYCDDILVIHGSQDEIVPMQTVLDWAAPQSLPIVVVPGTTHFFHGNLLIIKHLVLRMFRV